MEDGGLQAVVREALLILEDDVGLERVELAWPDEKCHDPEQEFELVRLGLEVPGPIRAFAPSCIERMHSDLRVVLVAEVRGVAGVVVVAVREHNELQSPGSASRVFEFCVKGLAFFRGAAVDQDEAVDRRNQVAVRTTKADDPNHRCHLVSASVRVSHAKLIITSKPVTKKLGTSVKAGSQVCHAVSGWRGGPMALISAALGAALPCRVSK